MAAASDDFNLELRVDDGVGVLQWDAAVDADTLIRAVSLAADDALLGHELRRVEVYLPVADGLGRRAVQRAGFRLEGIRREGAQAPDGSVVDVAMYARLASDIAYGETSFGSVQDSVQPKTRVIAHVVFRDAANQILWCSVSYKREWELPGGIVEAGESPREGAIREVREELGIDVELGRLLIVDWLPPFRGWGDAVELWFDGGVLTDKQAAAFRPHPQEITGWRFATIDEAKPHLIPTFARRLDQLATLAPGETRYLEAGAALNPR